MAHHRVRLVLAGALATLTVAALGAVSLVTRAHAALPGRNGLIAFTRSVSIGVDLYGLDIFTIRADGTGQRRLTWSHDASAPAFGPGGARILYQRSRHIWMMSATGANKVSIDTGPGRSSQPTWSPDGQQFAFVKDRGGFPQLYLYTFRTRRVTQLTFATDPRQRGVSDPAWSPRGPWIVFTREYDDGGNPADVEMPAHLWMIRSNGKGLFNLSRQTTPYDAHGPDWSPNGQRIVYTYGNTGPFRGSRTPVYLRNQRLHGYDVHDIWGLGDQNPAWSPDGRWIAVARPECCHAFDVYNPKPGLWLVRADGSAAHRIIVDNRIVDVSWQPLPQ